MKKEQFGKKTMDYESGSIEEKEGTERLQKEIQLLITSAVMPYSSDETAVESKSKEQLKDDIKKIVSEKLKAYWDEHFQTKVEVTADRKDESLINISITTNNPYLKDIFEQMESAEESPNDTVTDAN